jgi:hypothetical protein
LTMSQWIFAPARSLEDVDEFASLSIANVRSLKASPANACPIFIRNSSTFRSVSSVR